MFLTTRQLKNYISIFGEEKNRNIIYGLLHSHTSFNTLKGYPRSIGTLYFIPRRHLSWDNNQDIDVNMVRGTNLEISDIPLPDAVKYSRLLVMRNLPMIIDFKLIGR